jgi:phosphotransferase system HPr (HPr) family protein
MKELDIVIQNPTGLHARPAKIFVKTAKQFKSDIRVQHGEKKANAKSLISMLTLGVETNSEIRIIVDGVDEDEALQTLETAVREGLGEAEHIAQTAAAKSGPKPAAAPPPAAEPKSLENNHIQGIAAAPGIAIGPVYQFQQSELEIEETFAGSSQEQTRLQEAIERARGQLVTMRKQMLKRKADAEAAIFDVHLEILDDPDLLDTVLLKINEKQNAAQAWQETIDQRAELVAGLADPLLAARSADLHDVGYRVLRLLVGSEEPRYRLPDHPVIILAEDLSPSDTASLDKGQGVRFLHRDRRPHGPFGNHRPGVESAGSCQRW